jgi:hypothetical protein
MSKRTLIFVLGAVGVLGVGGCQSTPRAGGYAVSMHPTPRPEPRETPLHRIADPTRVAVIVSPISQDTNGDGFGDRISVSALLFGPSGPDPVFSTGAFVFELVQSAEAQGQGDIIKSWTIEATAVAQAEGPTMFGLPGYRFELDLGQDAWGLQPASANLLTGFLPSSGGPSVMPRQDRRLVRVGPVG